MKCITLNGALYRVKEGFDETEGSEDMRALIELDAVLRRGIERHVGGPQELTKTPKKKRGER